MTINLAISIPTLIPVAIYSLHLQEVIPEIEYFVVSYLKSWPVISSHIDYQNLEEILDILVFTRPSSTQNVEMVILQPLHALFISSSSSVQARILIFYTTLLRRWAHITITPRSNGTGNHLDPYPHLH